MPERVREPHVCVLPRSHRPRAEQSIFPAYFLDVVEAAGFADEIELDLGWFECGLQNFEKPRKSLRTHVQPHRLLGGPLLFVAHEQSVVVLSRHSTPEATRLEAGWQRQEPQGMQELL